MEIHWLCHRLGCRETQIGIRNWLETAAGVVVAVGFVWTPTVQTRGSRPILSSAAALVALGVVFVLWRLWEHGSPPRGSEGVREDLPQYLASWRGCYERQIRLLETVLWWYVLPLMPGMLLVLLQVALLRHPDGPWVIGAFVAVLTAIAAFVVWMHRCGAKALRKELDKIDECLASLRRDGPGPSKA